MDLTWLLLVMTFLSSVGYNKPFQWSDRSLHGQDEILPVFDRTLLSFDRALSGSDT